MTYEDQLIDLFMNDRVFPQIQVFKELVANITITDRWYEFMDIYFIGICYGSLESEAFLRYIDQIKHLPRVKEIMKYQIEEDKYSMSDEDYIDLMLRFI